MKKLMLVFAVAVMSLPAFAARGYVVRGGFGYGPGFGYWGPGYYGSPYAYGTPNAGELKLETPVKDAEVFINGAFAGTAGKLKTMYMHPGTYNVELRAPGREKFAEKVYIVAGKTLKLHPDLHVITR